MLTRFFHQFQRKPRVGDELYQFMLQPTILGRGLTICGLDDTLTGRFAVLGLGGALALAGRAESQAAMRDFVAALVADMDTALRENSLGDATVKKHVTNHAAALMGRMQAYGQIRENDAAAQAILARNLYGDAPSRAQAAALGHVLPQMRKLVEGWG